MAVPNSAELNGLSSLSLHPVPIHRARGKRGKWRSGLRYCTLRKNFTTSPHPLRIALLQVEPLLGDEDPEPLCEVSHGISLFPQGPPLQAHPQQLA